MADTKEPAPGELSSEKEMETKRASVDAAPAELVAHIDDKILKHSHDVDAAMKAFEGYEGQVVELSEETNRRLLRKIDRHLMPVSGYFIFVFYFYLYAVLFG